MESPKYPHQAHSREEISRRKAVKLLLGGLGSLLGANIFRALTCDGSPILQDRIITETTEANKAIKAAQTAAATTQK